MRSVKNRTVHKAWMTATRGERRAQWWRWGAARQALALLVVTGLVFSNLSNRAQAAAGDLDPTFDQDGKVTTSFLGVADQASAVTIQSDGRIVVAGVSLSPDQALFALARYNPDGSLDNTFGTGGKVISDVSINDWLCDLAIQADGRIVAVGCGWGNSTKDDFLIIRYLADGSLDSSFGAGGIVTTDFAGSGDYASGVVIQPDGRIVAAGHTGFNFESDFALVRYNADGSLDTTFGTGGKVTTNFYGNSDDGGTDIVRQTDGRLVVAGGTNTNFTNPGQYNFALARYNTDGSLDPTFGAGGKAITDFSANSFARAVAIQGDGRIVAAGVYGLSLESAINGDFALARYNLDGSLDTDFGMAGKVKTDYFGYTDEAFGVAIQTDDKIVAAGFAHEDTSVSTFALARYNADEIADLAVAKSGSPDPVVAGQNITYTITLINNGPDAAANVTLSDPTPPGTTFQSLAAPPGWACTTPPVGKTGTVICSIASLAAAQPAVFTLVVQVSPLMPDGSRVDNRVMVSSATADPNSNNNHASATTSVIGFSASIQDDGTGDLLKFNSRTGDYRFSRCGAEGFTFSGTGTIRLDSCNVWLTDSTRDHAINAAINSCTATGQASISLYSPLRSFTVNDRNTANNSCACP